MPCTTPSLTVPPRARRPRAAFLRWREVQTGGADDDVGSSWRRTAADTDSVKVSMWSVTIDARPRGCREQIAVGNQAHRWSTGCTTREMSVDGVALGQLLDAACAASTSSFRGGVGSG